MRGVVSRLLIAAAAAECTASVAVRAGAQASPGAALGPRGAIVDVRVSPETVTVGSPFTVRIRVRAPKIASVRFPPVPDSGDGIAPIDPRAIEENADTAVIDRTAVYRLVAWDVGPRTPIFGHIAVAAGGSEQRYGVVMPPVMVLSLLPADSSERVPREAREPIPLPSGWWRWALIGALLAGGLLWYWYRRRRAAMRVTPPPDAFVSATASFAALEALNLIEAGEVGRHLIAHVDVVRAYVARRFPSAGESATASQCVAALAATDFPILPARLGGLLERDATVRFAGAALDVEDARALAKEARAIVRDIQDAYEARLRAEDREPSSPRSRR
jgi:hypothetical protein